MKYFLSISIIKASLFHHNEPLVPFVGHSGNNHGGIFIQQDAQKIWISTHMKQKLPFVGGRDLSNLPKWGSETLNGIFGKWSIDFVYDEVGLGVACMCINAIVDFGNKLHSHPYETVTLSVLW